MWRFFLGLVLGLLLAGQSFGLSGVVGHGGTYAPMAFSASVFAIMTDLGPIIPLVATPFLWAFYFLLIPQIETFRMKTCLLVAVLLLHLLTGTWAVFDDDRGVARALHDQAGAVLVFFVLLLAAVGLLIYLTFRRSAALEPTDFRGRL